MAKSATPGQRAMENKREQILDEALILAGNSGYRGFSLKDLADRCNLTKQGVMHYFPTKDSLLVTLLHERDAAIEADLVDLLTSADFAICRDDDEKRKIFRICLIQVIENLLLTPAFIRLQVVIRAESISMEHPAKEYFVLRDQGTLTWLADRIGPFSLNAYSTARQILAVMVGLQEQWLQEEQDFDLVDEWRRALEKLLPDAPGRQDR